MRVSGVVCFLLLLLAGAGVQAATPADDALTRLNATLARKQVYQRQRWRTIDSLTRQFRAPGVGQAARFGLALRIYEQYRSFKYDSAFAYALRLQELGRQLRDPRREELARLRLAQIQLSAGMYKETFESQRAITPTLLDTAARQEFYFLKALSYSDLADYNPTNYYRPAYIRRAVAYLDTALRYSRPGTYEQLAAQGFKALKQDDLPASRTIYSRILALPDLTAHQYAINASTLAWVDELTNRDEQAVELLARAAVADVETATTETVALYKLSDYCYRRGDLKNAYAYINQAREDAAFYNARLRQIQVGGVYSTIEGERIAIIERQRRSLTVYAVATTLLVLLVAGFAVALFRQLKKLQRADTLIQRINQELQANNTQLNALNQQLSGLNRTLHEANRIKDEYVGYYFNVSSEYIDKIEKFRQALDKTLASKQYANTQKLVDSLNVKRERAELFRGFDAIFLKLFPNFVADFNALLRDDEQVLLADEQLLNTELRIFALIRLGIDDSERIGRILGYTLSTIYTYKARLKKKSKFPSEEFEDRVRAIQVA